MLLTSPNILALYLTFHDFLSVLTVALATRPENSLALSHRTRAMFEVNAAQRRARQFLLPRIQRNARQLLCRQHFSQQ